MASALGRLDDLNAHVKFETLSGDGGEDLRPREDN
jgi:hypothetical protein